ncbi:MAG: FMN-binding negative transcriptional regulator, partial [Paracoccaceae bacterium]
MHPNSAFRRASEVRNLAFAAERGFGMLTLAGPDGPLAAHIPFLLRDGRIEAHLARSNPILRVLDTSKAALLAVSGPDAYVSPDWYRLEEQVPTWNYVAVHLRGQLERRPQAELRGHLERLSARFEADLAPKPPWLLDKLSETAFARLARMIVPVGMTVENVDGTWKLAQNKPDAARLSAADALEATAAEMAALMR